MQNQVPMMNQMPYFNMQNHASSNHFLGNDGLLSDVVAQNVTDTELGQHANQFDAGLPDQTPFDKSADSPQQNFNLFEGVVHGLYEDGLHDPAGMGDAQDFLAI